MDEHTPEVQQILPKCNNVPPVSFLGACERYASVSRGHPLAMQHNIIGLEKIIISSIFPLSLNDFGYVFAIYEPLSYGSFCIKFISPSGEETLKIDIKTDTEFQGSEQPAQQLDVVSLHAAQRYWMPVVVLPDKSVIAKEPGEYAVVLSRDGENINIGYLVLEYVKVPPLTGEQVAAIRSNPHGSKKVFIKLECNSCKENITAYAALEKEDKPKKDNAIWYADLPDTFNCKCGKSVYNLKYIRENLHALLGHNFGKKSTTSFAKLYEDRALEEISKGFGALLSKAPKEEDIQKYIENNPILLQHFAPERILYKAPILSKFNTDIVIYSQNKELILLELEKPNTRLLKKDGGIAAELQHAIDQVNDWLYMSEKHRNAVLDCIGLVDKDVTKIKGVVIAGRDKLYRSEHLNKLRWKNFGNISFYTYDDLQNIFVNLIRSLKDL